MSPQQPVRSIPQAPGAASATMPSMPPPPLATAPSVQGRQRLVVSLRLVLATALALVPLAANADVFTATVTLADGDAVDLYLGPGHDVAVGDQASAWRTTVEDGFSRREEVARLEVTAVSSASCRARVTATAEGGVISVGLDVVFGNAVPDLPSPAQDQALMVARGDLLYRAGAYEAAAAVYDSAALIDPRANEVGPRQILAVLRGALERGDQGSVLETAASAFTVVQEMPLSPALAEEVELIRGLLASPPGPAPAAEPGPAPAADTEKEDLGEVSPAPSATASAPSTSAAADTVGPGEGDVVELGPEVTPPELARRVPLDFPPRARSQTTSAEVRLKALVGVDGRVVEVRVVEVSHPGLGFEEAAEASVRRWRFRPARAHDVRVRVWLPLRLQFRQ